MKRTTTRSLDPDTPEFTPRQEVACALRMSLRTFDRRVDAKLIEVTKGPGANGRVFLTREQLYAALEKRRRGEI